MRAIKEILRAMSLMQISSMSSVGRQFTIFKHSLKVRFTYRFRILWLIDAESLTYFIILTDTYKVSIRTEKTHIYKDKTRNKEI